MNFPIILNPFNLEAVNEKEIEKEMINKEVDNFLLEYDRKNPSLYRQSLNKPHNRGDVEFSWPELNFDNPFAVLLLFPFIPLLYLYLLFISIQDYFADKAEKARYVADYNEYLRLLPIVEKNNINYNDYVNRRNTAIDNFIRTLKKDKKFNKEIQNKKDLLQNLKLENQIRLIKQPSKANKETQQGISENYFFKYLNLHFASNDFEIMRYCELGHYFPDFVLKHKSGIILDIEIDEPYVGHTKEVIHYYNPEQDFYSDQYRNEFFLSNYWIVIRFTEKQVINHPDSCCFEIANFLFFNFDIDIPNSLTFFGPVPKEKLWSNQKANEMALFDYRNNYIRDELKNDFW